MKFLSWNQQFFAAGRNNIFTYVEPYFKTLQNKHFRYFRKFRSYFIIFFIASVIEEVLFRGYLLNNLMESFNKYIALVITAVLFSAVHLANPYLSVLVIFNLLLIGYLFGIYYIHAKNLWFSIFLHASWSFFQVAIFGFPVFGMKFKPLITQQFQGSPLLTGTNFGLEGSILITILTILSIFYLEKKYKKCKKEG